MKDFKSNTARRDFLKMAALSSLPLVVPGTGLLKPKESYAQDDDRSVNFVYDGTTDFLDPERYIKKLLKVNATANIQPDFYGLGGTTQRLEREFAKITGKEKAIYLPSGTMANQLAIRLLNDGRTKAMVPENSHIYRDEADSAQAVHNMRLIALGKDKDYFDLKELKASIAYHKSGEYIDSGLGTVVIENPVRRANGAIVPLDELKAISKYCRNEGYRLHLDGARLHIASAYTGVDIAEYAALFDTVYISLYKYLNAAGGAMLCGDASVIDKVGSYIKILGGTAFQSWTNTAMALHYLNGIDDRWKEVVRSGNTLISELNKSDQVSLTKVKNGSNLYGLKLTNTDFAKLQRSLSSDYNMMLAGPDGNRVIRFAINESLLHRDLDTIINAWETCLKAAKA
ncbi:MAG: threonine aldolase [Roseivirga sp.]|nr:threonine aldolase [Roseivirga sp.]